MSAPRSGSATTAVSTRSARFDMRGRAAPLPGAADLLARAAEAPLAAPEGLEGPVELFLAEVGPVGVREVELGVRRLPEEKIREALFARRPHEQVEPRQP